MKYINLYKNSSTPLYAQIKDSLKLAIKNGLLKPNDKLPTEEEICSEFNISRPVVRQAYKELLDENYIIRYKSRGTFVK
jgi:DNA-binding GntR family transcriptional regulator